MLQGIKLFHSNTPPSKQVLRVLAAMLTYPDEAIRRAYPEMREIIADEMVLTESRRAELLALLLQLQGRPALEAESLYIETFDRSSQSSLHLFEHVHGDSRDRGPALIDLQQTYTEAGLYVSGNELPDFLPMVLEFASTQPTDFTVPFLGEFAHILQSIFSALQKQQSGYASVIAAILELSGQSVTTVHIPTEASIDERWEEPPAFNQCSTEGQNKPNATQPIHFVKKAPSASAQSKEGALL